MFLFCKEKSNKQLKHAEIDYTTLFSVFLTISLAILVGLDSFVSFSVVIVFVSLIHLIHFAAFV